MGFVNIYYKNISEYKEEDLEQLRAMISPKRREILDRRKSIQDKIRTGMCEVLLWRGLVDIGLDISELEVSYEETKPQLRNRYLKSVDGLNYTHTGDVDGLNYTYAGDSIGLDFSFSHAGNYVFCAISDHPIGVDVEGVREKMPMNSSHVLSTKEIENVENSENPKYEFLKYWTCKEAFIKCAFPKKVNFRSGELDFSSLPYAMNFTNEKIVNSEKKNADKQDYTINKECNNKTIEKHTDYYFATYDLDENYRFSFCAKTDENFFITMKSF